MSNGKIKLACYWATACGGCDVAILDTDFKILELAEKADIVFWPIVVDTKESEVEAMPDGSIDLCLFNGTIRSSENEHMAKLLRQKSKTLVAFGACSSTGGIHGLINTTNADTIRDIVYRSCPSVHSNNETIPQENTTVPEGNITLPKLFDTVKTLADVVAIDYFVPGCPPAVSRISEILDAVLAGNLPAPGSVLGASNRALCETCPRKKQDLKVKEFKRPHLAEYDDHTCFLELGMICLGPITRGGCDEACVKSNMPCRGCYGLTPGVVDPGGAMIGALESVVDSIDPADIGKAFEGVRDPLGMFYMFTMAVSLLKRVG